MPKPYTDPEVIRMLREYRLGLIAREDDQVGRMAKTWLELEKSLIDQMTLLALDIQNAQAKGDVITEQLIRRMDRYQQLNKQMKTEILKYVKDEAIPDIEKEQLQFGLLGLQSASEGIRLTAAYGVQFNKLGVDNVE